MKAIFTIQNRERRRILKAFGLGSAALFLPRDGFDAFVWAAPAADRNTCVVRPEQTEGPFFTDVKLNRSDIRSDPVSRAVTPGLPLRLEFHVSRLSGTSCAPLGSALVDVWHCDAAGVYSDVRDRGGDTRGQKFLRGYQTTDANGLARFMTIYPGWYGGRAVHIHFKIRHGGARGREFTSQLYFDETINEAVFQEAPYAGKRGRRTTNDADFLFRNGGDRLLVAPVKDEAGYRARFDIALDTR